MAGKKLTPKQERFVAEYLIDLNATAAARRAGYSERTADRIGPELLGKTCVADAIAAAQSRLARKLEIKAETVLAEYARVAFSDIGHILDFSRANPHLRPACDIPEDARRAIASIKVKRHLEGGNDDALEVEVSEFKFWDKLNALEKLARHLGLLKDRVELTGKGGKPIEVTDPKAPDWSKLSVEDLRAIRAIHERVATTTDAGSGDDGSAAG